MKKCYLLLIAFIVCFSVFIRAERPFFDDNKRYLAVMLVNDHEESSFSDVIQAGYDNGFNAVYLTVRWDAIKCHNAACMSGTNYNSSWNPSNRYWTQIDAQVAQARQLGMKIAFRIHLGSADVTNFGAPAQRSKYLWGDNNYMRQPNGSEDLGGYAFRQFSFSSQPAIDSAQLFIAEVLNRYGYLETENNFLFYSVTIGGAQEMEYSGTYMLDYSTAAKNEYNSWYQSKYGTNPPFYPEEVTSTEGKKWYTFRHQKMKQFIGTVSTQIKTYNSNIKFVNDYGSVFDAISPKRGTFGFKSLGVNTDGVKVNDAEDYDHRFSMDILRTNFPGKWIMNEVLTQASIIQSNPSLYYDFMNDSYTHGAKIFTVVTSADQINAMASIYSQIKNQWLVPNFTAVSGTGSVSYTFDEILHASFNGNRFSTSSRNIHQEWLNTYNGNPSNAKPVNVYLNDDELNENCTTPAAPSLSASPSTITSGNSSTLSASGCSGGTITWSDGLGTGTSKSVSPTATKTYTATCSLNGCTSSAASVTVTVDPPPGGSGCVVNKVRFHFRQSGQCCMERLQGAKVQGSNDGSNWTDLYTFATDGTGSWQEATFSNTTAYSSARFVAGPNGYGELHELEFYNGSTKLNGTPFGTLDHIDAFDGDMETQWHGWPDPGPGNYAGLNFTGCSGGCTAPAAPSLSASPSTITSGNSTTLSASGCSGGTITWSDGLGTGTSKSVSPTSTKTYTATCTINSCTSSAANVTVTVEPPPSGGCVVNKARFHFRQSGQCCMERLQGAKIQGSNNGSSWTDLYTFATDGTGSWQEVTFSNTTSYTSVRFVAGPTGYGELHELEFYNGSTKLSGTPFGTHDHIDAFDGDLETQWHGWPDPGPGNYAGLNDLNGCSGSPLLLEEMDTRNQKLKLTVSPNPNKGVMNASFYLEKGKRATLVIHDLQGRTLHRQNVVGNGQHNEKIYLVNKASGMFILRLEKGNGIEVQKINIAR